MPLTSLEADAAVVSDVLDALPEPVVLVGHSYGGLVISKAAAGRSNVERLVYVAAAMVEADAVFFEVAMTYPTPLVDHTVFADDGTFTIDPAGAIESFYGNCAPEIATTAAGRLRPTSLKCLTAAPGAAAWHDIPSTYVLCSQDKAVAPDLQRVMSERATDIVELDTDHSPFLSTPDALVEILTMPPVLGH